jgi:hypothetical protein
MIWRSRKDQTIQIQHHHFTDPETSRRLGWIDEALKIIIQRLNKMALNFTQLESEVSEMSSAVDSAVTLLQSIAQEIRDSAGNQQKLNKLATDLDAKANVLAEAIAANTPADPNPDPVA